jgi:hypothetical protein
MRDKAPTNEIATSFRPAVVAGVEEIIGTSGLPDSIELCEALVATIDSIHSYTEEGVRLYPEILITGALEPTVQSLAYATFVAIGSTTGITDGLALAMKRCAPLARDGWIICAEIKGANLRYGLLTVETSELSPSVYRHVVGDLSTTDIPGGTIYIRGLGAQRVEVRTRAVQRIFSVSLKAQASDGSEVGSLAKVITTDIDDSRKETLRFFFAKVLGDSVRRTHGCLLAVVRDSETALERVKLTYKDGAYLDSPLDLASAVWRLREGSDAIEWMAVRNYRSLLTGMLSHDGVTLLSTRGRIIAYNVFVPRKEQDGSVHGGARSRAFHSLSSDGLVECAMAMSQDGGVKLWRPDQ